MVEGPLEAHYPLFGFYSFFSSKDACIFSLILGETYLFHLRQVTLQEEKSPVSKVCLSNKIILKTY